MNENKFPFIAIKGQTFFPNTTIGFDVGRDKSIAAVNKAMEEDKACVVATQKDTSINDPSNEDCYHTGVIIRIKQVVKRHENYIRVLAECESRVRIGEIYDNGELLCCDYELAEDKDNSLEDSFLLAQIRVLKKTFIRYIELSDSREGFAQSLFDENEDGAAICNIISSEIEIPFSEKQTLLEIDSVQIRIEHLIELINNENQVLSIAKRISNKVAKNMNRGQREYYLREQLQVIKEELGEDDNESSEIEAWKKKLDELKLPDKIDAKLRKEIDRFAKMHAMSPDANVSRTYIETILSLPWNNSSKANVNIKKAEKTLNEDHYGLEKVKERIVESLAVMHLTKGNKGQIICLVGPPGVGKTSIAKSIAKATNREYMRMSLGGIKDEAEIRGHRRTYIGAIPGRIINGIIETGTNNPLILFDEVDKIGQDFNGDPASALLEVLDPEQNKDFTDRYLEIPFDLSKAMFITTANTTATIPGPLLDRMEVIELPSYVEEEKVRIAEDYLLPKQLKEHAIKKSQLTVSESAIRDIINYYTREAGVRNLEREIANICRKSAKSIVVEKKNRFSVTSRNIDKFLGRKKFIEDMADLNSEVGTTTGLAWTAVGGVTLDIEVVKMPGSGKLVLTGQMGDVMKESAQTALGYVRSVSEKYNINEKLFKDYDIQIHIPEGATPKDGPSAGVTMTCALLSALTDKPARRNIAMTGEITLRGKVLRIGGLREKTLAAYRQGIKTVLVPKDNLADIEDIPATVRKKMKFIPLETAEDAIKLILE